jgi:DNA-binding transcriptional ArsR family regulator
LVAAVAEPNRRRLLQLLGAGEQTVSHLASQFTVSRSAISQHLGVLADSGLVTSRRAGKFQYYRLNARGMAALRAELDSFWTRELDQLARDARSCLGDIDAVREVGPRPAERRRDLRPDHPAGLAAAAGR